MKTVNLESKDYIALENAISKLSKGKVLVIGDLMLDTYLIGDSTRISPEAPVPVVKIEETRQTLGGAGNVARSIANLGGKVGIVGLVGKDNQALEMKELFSKESIETHCFVSSNNATTVKMRVLARGQQMLRMDQENTTPLTQAEYKEFLALLESVLGDYEYIIVSDYAKGLITQALMDYLTSYTNKAGKKLKILADPKPDNKHLYKNLFSLTPNSKETAELAYKTAVSFDEIKHIGEALRKELKLDTLLTTLGAHGMVLFSDDETAWHIPTKAKQVFDVTGAGDTVIATLALALSAGVPVLDSCILSNYAAGIVVAKVGSATANCEELIHAIKEELDTL